MTSTIDLPNQPASREQQPPLRKGKSNHSWTGFSIVLIIVNLLIVWLSPLLDLVVIVVVTDFLAVSSYIKKQAPPWKAFLISLLVLTVIFISLAEHILSNRGLQSLGMRLVLDIFFVDFIALLSYLITQRPQGRAKIIGYTVFITVSFVLFSVASEGLGHFGLRPMIDLDSILDPSWRSHATHISCPPPESTAIVHGRLGHPEKTVAGQVTVELTKPSFRRGEYVQVRVANGLDHPVYAFAWNTGCTIVSLERGRLIGWQETPVCMIGTLMDEPHYFRREIGTGEVVEVDLDPYDYRLLAYHMKPPAFGVGIYRVAFTYWPTSYLAEKTYLAKTPAVTSPVFVITP